MLVMQEACAARQEIADYLGLDHPVKSPADKAGCKNHIVCQHRAEHPVSAIFRFSRHTVSFHDPESL